MKKSISAAAANARRLKMSVMLLAMAMFSVTAMVYAWFMNKTDTDVGGADMNAGEAGSLSIRADASDDWSSELALTIDGEILSPITGDGNSFRKPVIETVREEDATVTDGEVFRKKVTGFTELVNPDAASCVRDFQLMYQENAEICVSPDSAFLDADTGEAAAIAPALRMAIYRNTGTAASPVYELKTVWTAGDEPESFAVLAKDSPESFRLRIWLEGTDEAANNLNCGERILLNLKFLVNGEET